MYSGRGKLKRKKEEEGRAGEQEQSRAKLTCCWIQVLASARFPRLLEAHLIPEHFFFLQTQVSGTDILVGGVFLIFESFFEKLHCRFWLGLVVFKCNWPP